VHLTPDQDAFWDWTWDAMAKYDVPALINYVRKDANVAQVAWIGHSQGTMQMFGALASQSFDSRHLSQFIALAPATFIGHVSVPFIHMIADIPPSVMRDLFGRKGMWDAPTSLQGPVCGWYPPVCDDFINAVFGADGTATLNQTRLPIYAAHVPAGTSTLNMLHYRQTLRRNDFSAYDYGSATLNEQHYNQPTPPPYNMTEIVTPPISIFAGTTDSMADPEDVAHLLSVLGKAPKKVVFIDDYDHMDFTWSDTAWEKVYTPVLSLLEAA
jgi:pimeloyl-ACP methyl ester carboxylesterase